MADVAVGGEGAPLVPYMDALLQQRHYQETGRVGMLLNIGGISNISARVPGGESGYGERECVCVCVCVCV